LTFQNEPYLFQCPNCSHWFLAHAGKESHLSELDGAAEAKIVALKLMGKLINRVLSEKQECSMCWLGSFSRMSSRYFHRIQKDTYGVCSKERFLSVGYLASGICSWESVYGDESHGHGRKSHTDL
jgi:hypothetical protein